MKAAAARALMALAACCMGESRGEWSAAMQAEYQAAAADGDAPGFAFGCLLASWRALPASEEGRFTLTSYGLALLLMIPMATVQIGCALLGYPYLYPGERGLRGALLVGSEHEALLRGVYQHAVPSLALLLLLLGIAQLCIAWAMLERNWSRAARIGTLTLASATTLIIFMTALMLDCSRALLQVAVLAIELAMVWMVARWHAQLVPPAIAEHPG
jgi:hypothetical protein